MSTRSSPAGRALAAAGTVIVCSATLSGPIWAQERTFSRDADFDAGILAGVNHNAVHDELQLDATVTPLDFLWFACTARGTLVRVDAATGAVLGEYRTAPDGRSRTPSRTAVDRRGSVWAGNRGEAADGQGSVVQVGVVVGGTRGRRTTDGHFVPDPAGGYLAPPFAYCTAIDRDGDGLIRTSARLGDVLAWPAGTDAAGGPTGLVHDALDECIRIYQRTPATRVQQVSLDAAGDVWVAGYPAPTLFCRLDPASGALLATVPVAAGGYGGCVDGGGVLWSAGLGLGQLLRLDVASGTSLLVPASQSCGVAIDSHGAVWNTLFAANAILKLDAAGNVLPGFPKPSYGGGPFAVAVTADDDAWVSNSTSHTVTRFSSDGTFRKRISVGTNPNGLAVDGSGRVWVTNQGQSTAMRIDPHGGPDGLGAVDLTVGLGTAAGPVNYSHMAATMQVQSYALAGTWTVVHDGGRSGLGWTRIAWTSREPAGTRIAVAVRAAESEAVLGAQAWLEVANGADMQGVAGRYLEIRATLARNAQAESTPALLDLTVETGLPPDCAAAHPSIERIWPPNHRLVDVQVLGLSDPDGDPVTCRITRITCDEPLAGRGGSQADARGVGTAVAHLAATRLGSGNGRVYQIEFTASDGQGGECSGQVQVCVPHDRSGHSDCIDDGQVYEVGMPVLAASPLELQQYPNPFNPRTTIDYVLPAAAPVRIGVYDAAGRCVRVLAASPSAVGPQRTVWDGNDARGRPVASGVYVLDVQAGDWHETRRMLLLK